MQIGIFYDLWQSKRNKRNRMKGKSLWTLIVLTITLGFIACDDNLNSIGFDIQPPSDSISVANDTVDINARTISMRDSVYARTINGTLGMYEDPIFGTIKSDYLCQFYFPDSANIHTNKVEVDSVRFLVDYLSFTGDSLAPLGLSVYRVTKPLTDYFYTNVDPKEYCNMEETLAQEAFTVSGSQIISTSGSLKQRRISAKLDNSLGVDFFKAYSSGKIENSGTFNKYFPGTYVTTNFGSGCLLGDVLTYIRIHYKYTDIKGNHNGTQDTIRSTTFTLAVTTEVIQLNHIKNGNPTSLFTEGTGETYLKTPAGVYTELEFPVKEISNNMTKKNLNNVLSAQLTLKGYTEKETDEAFDLSRPTSILLIDKDSIHNFFTKRQQPDNITSYCISRNTSYNTYDFTNLSSLVNHYKDKNIDIAKFAVIPVGVETNSTTGAITKVYNYMQPSSAILRSNKKDSSSKNMQMTLVYSRF